MITVAHCNPRVMVSTHMRTTPAATSRAETSLTGLGNEKRAATRPEAPEVVLSPPMTWLLPESSNPDHISRVSLGNRRTALVPPRGPPGPVQASGRGTGWGGGDPT